MIATGANHTCAVTSTGGAQCWGINGDGQLGNGTTTASNAPVNVTGLTSGVKAIVAGYYHACALTTAGGVKCWGWNANGQLGNGTFTDSTVPVNVTGLTSGVTAISAGDSHTCALTTSGGVKCWGWNALGQLGNGSTTNANVPVDVTGRTSGTTAIAAGVTHTCAVTSAGAAQCWGNNGSGRLGNGTSTNASTPVNVTGLTSGVASIAAGNHTCAVTTGGSAKCWGPNAAGQLGNGTTTASNVPVNVTGLSSGVATIGAGWDHTCAITTSGAAKCWGDNSYRGLGNGTNTNATSPGDVTGLTSGVATIEGGAAHTCAITTTGIAKCWGYNGGGQLGDGTDVIKGTPTNVTGSATYGAVATAAIGPNVDLLWWAPGNGATQTEILWTELESIS
jgi:alpha-tubulin suppressor-like RCC1 family protein